MTDVIRVVLIDDHPLFRDGVKLTLNKAANIQVVGEGSDASDAARIASAKTPDVVLMDINMPGNGIAAAKEFAISHPDIKVIFLTMSEADADVSQAMEWGARGYVLKGISGPELVQVVRIVHGGGSYVSPSLAARILRTINRPSAKPAAKTADKQLTKREEQILAHVALGLTNKEVAGKLKLSEKTVKHYMTAMMQKLQVRNRVEAVLATRTTNNKKP